MVREITIDPEDDDELDDEEIWTSMCEMTAMQTGISAERAKALLEREGFHTYGNTGIVEAIEVVVAAVGRGKNPFEKYSLPPPNSKA